jgi:6-pyruvoyltetrahydropterin/6-carboxytetrahydropterin synthase
MFDTMTRVRVTKQFGFEMAHALWNYDGPCRNLHGHSYRLYVTVTGHPIKDNSNPKHGMLIDFGDLKKIVNEAIIDIFDHAVMISSEVPPERYANMEMILDNLQVADYQPTCENMVVDFAERIKSKLPRGVDLFSLRLDETATSYAEWYASDNPK